MITPMNAATMRTAFNVILPAVLMVSAPRMALAADDADDADATGTSTAFRLLDADSVAVIANARVVIASAWEYWGADKRRHSLSLPADPMEAAKGFCSRSGGRQSRASR